MNLKDSFELILKRIHSLIAHHINIWIGNWTFTHYTNYDCHANKPFHCFSSSHIFSRLFMNINIPSQDDGVLTAASDDGIQGIFSQKYLSTFRHFHSRQYSYKTNISLFTFGIFPLKPTAKDLQCFFSKAWGESCEISWNNSLAVEQITLLKVPRGPGKNTKTTK